MLAGGVSVRNPPQVSPELPAQGKLQLSSRIVIETTGLLRRVPRVDSNSSAASGSATFRRQNGEVDRTYLEAVLRAEVREIGHLFLADGFADLPRH